MQECEIRTDFDMCFWLHCTSDSLRDKHKNQKNHVCFLCNDIILFSYVTQTQSTAPTYFLPVFIVCFVWPIKALLVTSVQLLVLPYNQYRCQKTCRARYCRTPLLSSESRTYKTIFRTYKTGNTMMFETKNDLIEILACR